MSSSMAFKDFSKASLFSYCSFIYTKISLNFDGAYELLDLLPVVALGGLLIVECGLVKVRHVAIVAGLCQKKG